MVAWYATAVGVSLVGTFWRAGLGRMNLQKLPSKAMLKLRRICSVVLSKRGVVVYSPPTCKSFRGSCMQRT